MRLGTTCSRDVAVSVRTPPRAPRWTERAVLEKMREEAGRERREKERANTMLNVNEWNEVFQLDVEFEFELALQWVKQCKKRFSGSAGRR